MKEKFTIRNETDTGHMTIDMSREGRFNEIDVTMKSVLRGDFIAKYKYKDSSTFFLFSLQKKIYVCPVAFYFPMKTGF